MKPKFLASVVAMGLCTLSFAQKKPLDHSVYDSWQRVSAFNLTPDGSVATWTVAPQEGDAVLYIRNAQGKVLEIPRGAGIVLSADAKWAYCTIAPQFSKTREAKIKKKKDMPKDSLAVVRLSDLSITKYADAKGFKTGSEAMPYLAYMADKDLVALDPATGKADTLKHAGSYVVNKDASAMAVVVKKDKKDSLSVDGIVLYCFATGKRDTLARGAKYYSSAAFDQSGSKFVFLSSTDSLKDGSKNCAINLYDGSTLKEVLAQGSKLDSKLIVNENAAPYFSQNGSRLIFGLGVYVAPKDTTIYDFETAKLDIWNWDGLYTPPMQKVGRGDLSKKTYTAMLDLQSGKVLRLENDMVERVSLCGGDGDWAYVADSTPYTLSSYWDSNDNCDFYRVSLKDGSRTALWKGQPYRPNISNSGNFVVYYNYNTLQWYLYDAAKDRTVCLTEGLGVNFHDDEDDHPMVPGPIGSALWAADESCVFISDRYDLWKFSTADGSAVCVTNAYGRRNNVELRYMQPVASTSPRDNARLGVRDGIETGKPVWFTAFDRIGKKNGTAVMKNLKKAADPVCMLDENAFGALVKAKNAAVVMYTKGNFRNPNDLYIYSVKQGKKLAADFSYDKKMMQEITAQAQKLTSINPQQADYRWGDVQLVHWNAYDGTPLDGLLFVPEDMKAGEKLPMMVYFYEKNAETMYSYRTPAPSRSVINVSYFVSNGYCVFIPDIVYKDGHPGESAYNCIVSGAEAMCDQFSFIDKERMAIQGQSWGGYQVAYLVTRTSLFKAAGAGAPVGNMTSAYGGIRWESGLVRAMQYEHGQSRIGKSMWEDGGLELYIENSPVFHVNKVTTPVLIMANDNDGAVPWYQGIEFFSNLRRFGKPAWMLQYNNEAHNLVERRNCKDLSIRLQQFFDHYLKGAPMPVWMKNGVPVYQKGQYFGFETAE